MALTAWQIWIILGVFFLLIEGLTPTLFFLTISMACFVSCIVSFFGVSALWQVIVWVISSIILLAFFRPFLLKTRKKDTDEFVNKYIGKTATVTEPVSKTGGRIAIYGEAWSAVVESDDVIEKDSQVKIIKTNGNTMIVEKI